MQTYLNVRAINVGNDTTQGSRGADPARAIPVGREISATVVQVSQSQSQPGQFTLQLQMGSRVLELTTPRPFPQGSQVLLSRDAQGNIQLQVPTNNGSTNTDANRIQNAPAQAKANAEALLMRISANSSQQAANLPVNQAQKGIVLAQPSTSAAQPANSQVPANLNTPSQNSVATTSPQTAGNQAANSGANAALGAQGSGNIPAAASALTAQSSATTALATQTTVTVTNQTTSQSNTTTQPTSTTVASPSSSSNAAANTNSVARLSSASTNTASNLAASVNQAGTLTNINLTNANQTNTNAITVNLTSSPGNSAVTTLATNASATNPAAPQNAATGSASMQTTATPTVSGNPSPLSPIANLFNSNEAINRPQGFPVRVLVAGQVIDLVSPRPIQAGQQVDVTRNEQGLIRVQFSQPATPLAQQPAIQAIMQQALREVLPVQLPLADGLNQLLQISERQGAKQNGALNQLIQSMLGLFSVKPGSADAENAIARNLQQGGLLSEAGLSKTGQQTPPPDLKQQLGQLLKVAEQLPAQAREQLNQLVNSLLARSTAQQINSLQHWRDLPDGGQERHYRLDLPIQQQKGFENAELRITEHRRRNEEGEFVTLWTVRLHFELEEDGGMDAELSLQDRFQLNANFWVEKPETLERLRERLNSFEQELKTKGFEVAPLNARLGKLENPQVTPLNKRLVDIHT